MTVREQARFWLVAVLAAGVFLYLLGNILLPFVLGMAVAYFLDPVADRLEAAGLSRTMATSLITALFILAAVLVILLLVPLLHDQAVGFLERLPDYVRRGIETLQPIFRKLSAIAPGAGPEEIKATVSGYASKIVSAAGSLLAGLWGGGLALVNLISLLVITPVVTFYLLRDWDRIVGRVQSWLPRDHAPVIVRLARDIDAVLAGFVRGQASVCLILVFYYAGALMLVGLEFGLVIGILAGLISFVPYVGAIVGFVASMGVAILQFWPDYPVILAVGGIYVVGQVLEGNFLTPKLVGERVGLHPVWVIFGLLAGGSLFGFVGMLLALPVAASIGVLARFGLQSYLASRYYLGKDKGAGLEKAKAAGDPE